METLRVEKFDHLRGDKNIPGFTILKPIGDHIRAWRLNKNLLQADVSKILSVSEDTVVGWEKRNVIPSPQNFKQIIRILGYDPRGIFKHTLS